MFDSSPSTEQVLPQFTLGQEGITRARSVEHFFVGGHQWLTFANPCWLVNIRNNSYTLPTCSQRYIILYWWHLHSANFISRHTSHPVSTKAEVVTLFHHPLPKQWTEAKIYYTEQRIVFSWIYRMIRYIQLKTIHGFQKPIWEWCRGTPPRPWLTFRPFKLVTYKPARRVYTLHRLWHDW